MTCLCSNWRPLSGPRDLIVTVYSFSTAATLSSNGTNSTDRCCILVIFVFKNSDAFTFKSAPLSLFFLKFHIHNIYLLVRGKRKCLIQPRERHSFGPRSRQLHYSVEALQERRVALAWLPCLTRLAPILFVLYVSFSFLFFCLRRWRAGYVFFMPVFRSENEWLDSWCQISRSLTSLLL